MSSANHLILYIFIAFLIALEDILHGAEDAFEALPADVSQSDGSECLHTGLATHIVYEGELSEIVSLFILIYNLR